MIAARAVEQDFTVGEVLEAGHHPKERRLPAAGRADKNCEGAGFDREIDAVDDLDGVEAFADAFQLKPGHVLLR